MTGRAEVDDGVECVERDPGHDEHEHDDGHALGGARLGPQRRRRLALAAQHQPRQPLQLFGTKLEFTEVPEGTGVWNNTFLHDVFVQTADMT